MARDMNWTLGYLLEDGADCVRVFNDINSGDWFVQFFCGNLSTVKISIRKGLANRYMNNNAYTLYNDKTINQERVRIYKHK